MSPKILLRAFVGKMSIVTTVETLDLLSIFERVVVVVVDSSIPFGVLSITLLFSAMFSIMTLLTTLEAFYLAMILFAGLISTRLFIRDPISMFVVVVAYISPIDVFVTSIVAVTMVVVIVSSMLMSFRTSTVLMESMHLL